MARTIDFFGTPVDFPDDATQEQVEAFLNTGDFYNALSQANPSAYAQLQKEQQAEFVQDTGVQSVRPSTDFQGMQRSHLTRSETAAVQQQLEKDPRQRHAVSSDIYDQSPLETAAHVLKRGIGGGVTQLAGTLGGMNQQIGEAIPGGYGDPLAEAGKELSQRSRRDQRQLVEENPLGEINSALASAISSTTFMVPALATGNPGAALMTMGGMTQANTYGDLRERGFSPVVSGLSGVAQGSLEVLGEKAPTGYLFEMIKKPVAGALFKTFGKMVGADVIGEAGTTLSQDIVDRGFVSPDATPEQIQTSIANYFSTGEWLKAQKETLLSTLFQNGMMGAGAAGVSRLGNKNQPTPATTDVQQFADSANNGTVEEMPEPSGPLSKAVNLADMGVSVQPATTIQQQAAAIEAEQSPYDANLQKSYPYIDNSVALLNNKPAVDLTPGRVVSGNELVLDEAKAWGASQPGLQRVVGEGQTAFQQRLLYAYNNRNSSTAAPESPVKPSIVNDAPVQPEQVETVQQGDPALDLITNEEKQALSVERDMASAWERGSVQNGRSNKTQIFPWLDSWGKTTPLEVATAIDNFLTGKRLGDVQKQLVVEALKGAKDRYQGTEKQEPGVRGKENLESSNLDPEPMTPDPASPVPEPLPLAPASPAPFTFTPPESTAKWTSIKESIAGRGGMKVAEVNALADEAAKAHKIDLAGSTLQERTELAKQYKGWKESQNGLSEVREETGNAEEVFDVRGEDVNSLAHEAASSPLNDLPEPTPAQIEAGNYKKGHVNLHGLDISIENPAGSIRRGVDETGREWETKLAHHYGYIKGTVGRDKDHVDVFVGPAEKSDQVWVVDQIDPKTGRFDEHKVMLGFASNPEARQGYLDNYDTSGPQRIGAITRVPVTEFKQWLKDGNTKKPFNRGMPTPAPITETPSETKIESGASEPAPETPAAIPEQSGHTSLIDHEIASLSLDDMAALFDEVVDSAPAPVIEVNKRKFRETQRKHIFKSMMATKDAKELARLKKKFAELNKPAVVPEQTGKPAKDNGETSYFKKGERVQFKNGVHGEIVDVTGYTVSSGMLDITRGGGVGWTERKQETNWMYQVRKDNGVVVSGYFYEMEKESDPVPDFVPAPKYNGKTIDADALKNQIENAHNMALKQRNAAERAKKQATIQELRQRAELEEKKAQDMTAVLNEWVTAHPEEAAALGMSVKIDAAPQAPDVAVSDVKVSFNKEKEGIELRFNGKPDADVLVKLKNMGFKWSMRQKVWYAKDTGIRRQFAEKLQGKTEAPETTSNATRRPKGPEYYDVVSVEYSDDAVSKQTKSASDILKAAAESGVKGAEESLKGLYDLFGGSSLKSFPGGIDADTYAKAKPHFQSALDNFREAGKSLKEYFSFLADQFGAGIKPYIMNFMQEMQQGTVAISENSDIISNESESTEGGETDESTISSDDRRRSTVREVGESGVGENTGGQPVRIRQEKPTAGDDAEVLAAVSPDNVGTSDTVGDSEGTGSRAGLPVRGVLPEVNPVGNEPDGRPGGSTEGLVPDGTGKRRGGTGRKRGGDDAGSASDSIEVPDGERNTRPVNYHIADPEQLIGGTPKVRFARNRAAIEALQSITSEGRTPLQEELDSMAAYIGWGSFGQELFQGSFDYPRPKPEWQKESDWLREHLGKEAWESAQRSIINAHYTDPPTVQSMWDIAKALGFKGGRVLEPSMGIGNFFGLMPRNVMEVSQLAGIELDKTTGGMAQVLYPEANIQIKGYQESKTADNFYDLVIGNWPFAKDGPADRRYRQINPSLHDYFFLKALDQVRPGGLVIGVTSSGTMDKIGSLTRMELARKADLVAAFRLPSGAFGKYAGTSVVTDIIILQKRENPNLTPSGWIKVSEHKVASGVINTNEYWLSNPENVLGEMDFGSGTTRGRAGMIVNRPDNYADLLAGLAARVPKGVYNPKAQTEKVVSYITNNTKDRQQSIIIGKDDALYVVQGEYLAPLEQVAEYKVKDAKATTARLDQIKRLVNIRKAYGNLIDAERNGEDVTPLRKDLAKQYEAFNAKHGRINASFGLTYMKKVGDPFYATLAALEVSAKNGALVTYRPAKILYESTIRAQKSLDNPTVRDAYVMARNENLNIDLERIAELSKKTVQEVKDELMGSGSIYLTPAGNYEVSDQYLSGNVRRKMREAEAAQAEGMDMSRNIEELKKIMPVEQPYYKIEAKFGAPWVSAQHYERFVADLLGEATTEGIDIAFHLGAWKVKFEKHGLNHKPEARTSWGHPDYYFNRLVQAAMNNSAVTIWGRDMDGNKVIDDKATAEANEKAGKIREEFSSWVWKDTQRKFDLEKEYNEVMNAIADTKFDGSFLTFAGMALTKGENQFNLRKHQIDAIWRGILNKGGLYAHEVGTGKTYTMGGIAVESRRYGVAKKPLIFAHNANSASVAAEIQEMYPGAKILYIDNLAPDKIDITMRQIANDDWDAVVVPHSLISRFGLQRETLDALAAEEIAQLEQEAIEAAQEDGVELTPGMMNDEDAMKRVRSVTAKSLVHARNRIIKKIDDMALRASKENAVSFEQLGVDMIIVDEVHEFKKPPLTTKMKMKGLNTGTSDQSLALHLLTGYVKQLNAGKGVHVFTGTPITNTLTEIYHMMRYVMDNEMERSGLKAWDSWFNTFADSTSDVELSAAGDYEAVTRLAAFVNVPELRKMLGQYTDIVFADDMPEFEARTTRDGKTLQSPELSADERDQLVNGRTENPIGRPYKKIVNEVCPMGEQQKELLTELKDLARLFRNASKKDRRQMMLSGHPASPILVETNAANAGMDVRLVNMSAEDSPDSKVNKAVRNILDIYKGDKRATQVIFMERGFSDKATSSKSDGQGGKIKTTRERFNLAKDIVDKLVKGGVQRDQIAIVDGSVSKEKRKEVAKAMNKSQIRVVIGNTKTLGVGVNMQDNLKAMHHLDAPWMPGELEQRNGRGWRQGNKWNTVLEIRYITEGLDGRRWQVLVVKDRFIKAFLKAKDDVRVIEGDAVDVDESGDLAETLSEAAGDPRLLLREKYKKDIEKLQNRERMHAAGIIDAEQSADKLSDDIEFSGRSSELLKQVIGLYEANNEKFSMKVDGKEYESRGEAQEALDVKLERIAAIGDAEKVGEIYGFDIKARWNNFAEKFDIYLTAPSILKDMRSASVDHDTRRVNADVTSLLSAKPSVASIESVLRHLPKHYDTWLGKMESKKESVKNLRASAKEPFARAEELKKKKQMLADLMTDLDRNPVPPPSWLRIGSPVGGEVYYKGEAYPVIGHKWDSSGWFVLVEKGQGQEIIDYKDVTDENGSPVYEEREFDAPVVAAQPAAGTTLHDITSVVPLALTELAKLARYGKESLPHLVNIGRRVKSQGADNYTKFAKGMKQILADMWSRFRSQMIKVWQLVKNERGLLGDVDISKENGENADKINSDRLEKIAGGMYVPERVPQEIIGEGIERNLRAAADVSRGVHSSVQESEVVGKTYDQRLGNYLNLLQRIAPSESAALRSWAQDQKMLLDDTEFTAKWKAQGEMGGSEHDIYVENGRFFKRNNLILNPSLLDYLNRLIIHNRIFPEAAYELEGFVESHGGLLPIVSQKAIQGTGADYLKIRSELTERGLTPIIQPGGVVTGWKVKDTGIIVRDVHKENALVNEHGSLAVFDPQIEFDIMTKDARLKKELAAAESDEADSFIKKQFGDSYTLDFMGLQQMYESLSKGKLKDYLNPLDFSRFKNALDENLSDKVKHSLGFFMQTPYWKQNEDKTAKPFYREGRIREEERFTNNIRMLGGLVDDSGKPVSMKQQIADFFSWSDMRTKWEDLKRETYNTFTPEERTAYDVIRFEGDAQGTEYLTLATAKMNSRIKASGINAKVFDFYRKAIDAEDVAFEEKLTIARENMVEAGISEDEIEGHISEYRAKFKDIRGWVHRDHGEGEQVVTVHHVIDRLDFITDDVELKSGAKGFRVRLGYYPGLAITTKMRNIVGALGGTWKQTANGTTIMLFRKSEAEEALNLLNDIELEGDNGYSKVMVYNRYTPTKSAARKHADEVKSDFAKAMPVNYRYGHNYEVSTKHSTSLVEDEYQDLRMSDMALERVLDVSLQRARNRGEIDSKEAEDMYQAVVQNIAESLLGRGAGLYQIRRVNYLIEGYDRTDAIGKFESYVHGVAGMLSKAMYALRQFKHMKRAPIEIRRWATSYIDGTLRNMGRADRISGDVRALASLWYLGGNLTWMLINHTQPYVFGQAELSRHTKGALRKIVAAEKDILTKKLNQEEQRLWQDPRVKVQIEETTLAEMAGSDAGIGGKVSRGLHKLTGASMAHGHKIEVLNRKVVILAAYRAFRDQGFDSKEALGKALDVNSAVNIDMGRYNLPMFAQKWAVGRGVYALQSFIQHALQYLYYRGTSGDKRDQKAILRLLFVMALIGGLPAGAPGSDELDKMILKIFGYSPKMALKNYTRKMAKLYGGFGEALDGFVWHGVPGAFKPLGVGVSFTGSVQFRMPIISNLIAGDDVAKSMTGALGGLVQKGIMAGTQAARGDLGRAAEYAAPTAISNVMSAARQSDGVRTSSGKPVFYKGEKLKMTPTEAGMRAVGMQPARIADVQESRQFERKLQAEWNGRRKDALDEYRFGKGMAPVREFNNDLKGSQAEGLVNRITPDTIAQAKGKSNKKQAGWERKFGL